MLEIGYGPGIGIALLAQRLPAGRVFGIDPSRVMRSQADRRSKTHRDRVDLQIGTVTSLPWPNSTFDAVCSANSAQLWDPLEEATAEIARVLKPSGRLALALHQRAVRSDGPFVDEAFSARLDQALTEADFQDVRTERLLTRGGILVTAHRSDK